MTLPIRNLRTHDKNYKFYVHSQANLGVVRSCISDINLITPRFRDFYNHLLKLNNP